jgi:type II secretory ATPase GspE/PulE/Tfp pilus assembly ATPase PilB-like protein/CheY-like chemotaxis protein
MLPRQTRDSWLLPTLESLLPANALAQLGAMARDSLWDACVAGGFATDAAIVDALAARFRMGVADLAVVTARARELVPEPLARRYHVLPLSASDALLDVATADPHDLDGERALAFATGRRVRLLLAPPGAIARRIDEIYQPERGADGDGDPPPDDAAGEYDLGAILGPDDGRAGADDEHGSAGPITRLVSRILADAIAARASDVHVEAEEDGVAVRCRIDGVLRRTLVLPRAVAGPLVSRVKIMAKLDIADRLRPQDGRARVLVDGRAVDLRVSTLPSSHGEKVVVRVLDQRSTVLSLDALGLSGSEAERVERLLSVREGLVLVTGPTGSGKTTTLYTMLRRVQERGVNVVTVEDPVEYRLPGIVQVQVHEKAGLTFATALRSILRQDPDVVLVGEIRDRETAEIAIQASLTGHLVFSTLHTIDSVSAVARLADLGVESYKLAAALKGVIAQRLLRRLCPQCRAPEADPVAAGARSWLPEGALLRGPVGCAECAATGYRGRLAATEVLVVDRDIERAVAAGEPAGRLAEVARRGGMQTLWEVGLAHVRTGATSVDELLRVVEPPVASVRAERPGAGEGPGEGGARMATTPAAVLLVSDAPAGASALRAGLERAGHVVRAVTSADAPIAVRDTTPAAIVVDASPGSVEATVLLRALSAEAWRPPIVVVAPGADESLEARLFAGGAADVATRPGPLALAARLRAILARA